MRLRTTDGYRAIHCKPCGRQERCSHNTCQCGIVWHHCESHRTDPMVHASRKGVAKVAKEKAKEEVRLSSTRRAPRSGPQDNPKARRKQSCSKGPKRNEAQVTRHVKFEASRSRPNDNIIKRLRMRIADQKVARSKHRREAEENVERLKSSGNQVEAILMKSAASQDESKWTRSHLHEFLVLKAARQSEKTKDKQRGEQGERHEYEIKNSMHEAKRERKWFQGDKVENCFPASTLHAKRKRGSITNDAINRLVKKSKSERTANMSTVRLRDEKVE